MTALKRASGAQALTGPLHCCHPTPHGRLRHDELRDLNQSISEICDLRASEFNFRKIATSCSE